MIYQVRIDFDMLGVVAYLSNSRVTWWLNSLFEQIEEHKISDHLAALIMDSISYSDYVALVGFVCGRCELTEGTKRRYSNYGLLFGSHVPDAVKRRCRLLEKAVFE